MKQGFRFESVRVAVDVEMDRHRVGDRIPAQEDIRERGCVGQDSEGIATVMGRHVGDLRHSPKDDIGIWRTGRIATCGFANAAPSKPDIGI